MEEIYIIKHTPFSAHPNINESVIAIDSMSEKDFAFSRGQVWNEERPDRLGYRVRLPNGEVWWWTKEETEQNYREMTLQEAEMVNSGQFLIPSEAGFED